MEYHLLPRQGPLFLPQSPPCCPVALGRTVSRKLKESPRDPFLRLTIALPLTSIYKHIRLSRVAIMVRLPELQRTPWALV